LGEEVLGHEQGAAPPGHASRQRERDPFVVRMKWG